MVEKNVIVDYIRFIEIICIALFIFGFLWNATDYLNLTPPQFFMLYGGTGAAICEILCRIILKKKLKIKQENKGNDCS